MNEKPPPMQNGDLMPMTTEQTWMGVGVGEVDRWSDAASDLTRREWTPAD